MMTTTDNDSDSVINAGNDDNMSTANLNAHVNSINDNPHDYSSFNMRLVLNYMNNQLIYYYISDAILAAEQACFQQLMKQCKTSLEMLEYKSIKINVLNISKLMYNSMIIQYNN